MNSSHLEYEHQILTALESDRPHSQRSLASSLGIALGLTNLLIQRLVSKGWVRVVQIKPNRFRYFLTPTGMAEKARMSRLHLQASVKFYISARDRIRESLSAVGAPATRIVFFGTGEVAEIAYVCLQETDLHLVGVAGDGARRQFFGLPVHAEDDVRDGVLGEIPYDRLVVTTFDNVATTYAKLDARGIPPSRVHWL